MTTPTYVSPFTGTVVQQTDVTYHYIVLNDNYQFYWPQTAPPTEYALARIMDIEPTTTDQYIALPKANEGTVGTDSFIVNRGMHTFTVYNFDYTQSWTIDPGIGLYFYLNQNDNTAGYWETVVLGAGTSLASAAALAGTNLYVRNALLAVGFPIVEVNNPPTITNSNSGNTYVWQGGSNTIQLPAAATLDIAWFIGFRNNGTGQLTFQAQGTSVINTNQSLTTNPGDSGLIFFNYQTNNFYTVGLSTPNVVTFTSATYDVDAVVGNTLDLTSNAPIIQTYVALAGTRTQDLNIDLPPITQIYVFVNSTGQPGYDLKFNVSGSMSPPLTVGNNTVVLAISDGNTVVGLSTTSVPGIFQAINGSAASPSYAFVNDTSTGLYLANPNVLGVSAGGLAMMAIDKSNPLDPVVNSLVRLNATSIEGGTF